MIPLPRRSFVLLVFGLCLAPSVTVAQNIASNHGTSGQNRERLTLLPGPGLLSPGRGMTVPQVDGAGNWAPAVVRDNIPSIRFVPSKVHARPTPSTVGPSPMRQSGVQPMSFDSTPPPAVMLARPPLPAPAVGELRFDAKLPPAPDPALKRD